MNSTMTLQGRVPLSLLLLLLLLCVLPSIMTTTQVQALPQFDDETYQRIMDDPRVKVETVYTSYAGITTARMTSFISSLSSCLIIIIIARSATKLTTSYHRLVFGMSVADTIGSLAIFCSTWLMPKDMIYQQFEGAVYGNASTCTAQGFMFFSGVLGTFAFNTALCIYYASVIRYKISEERFQKCVEPILISLAFIATLIICVPLIYFDLFVPTPWDFSCTGARYPYWCGIEDMEDTGDTSDIDSTSASYNEVSFGKYGECEKPVGFLLFLRIIMLGLYFGCAFIIFSSMFIICWTVYVQERILKRYLRTIHGGNGTSSGNVNDIHNRNGTHNHNHRPSNNRNRDRISNRNTSISTNIDDGNDETGNHKINITEQWRTESKLVLHQAMGYIAAFVLCQVFPLVSLLQVLRYNVKIFQYSHIALRPLQGFFNFLIFMGHKVQNRRRADNTLSRWEAFWIVIKSGRDEMEPTLFIGNITMVVKRGNGEFNGDGDDDMLDISFSEVRDSTVHNRSGTGGGGGAGGISSMGMLSMDPSANSNTNANTNTKKLRESGSTAEANNSSTQKSETGLSYEESHYNNSNSTRTGGDASAGVDVDMNIDGEVDEEVDRDVFNEDYTNTSNGVEIASQSYWGSSLNSTASRGGIMSWYSRATPNSRDISHAVSSIDS